MRKICTLFSAMTMVLLSALTFSCKEESVGIDPAMPRLALTKDTVSVSFTGGYAAVNVSAGGEWKATSVNEWIEMEPGEGPSGTRALMLEVGENPDIFPRIGRIVIKSANLTDTLYVEQEAAPITDKIELDPTDNMTFIAAGESKSLSIWANIPWTATFDADWIEMDATSGEGDEVTETIHISAGEWLGLEPREAQITFKGGLADDVVLTVVQEAFVPEISTSEVYMFFETDGTGEKTTFTVTSNTDWSATADSWINVTPTNGKAGTTEVTVSLNANEGDEKLTGSIKLATAVGTATAEVAVEQEGNIKEPDTITASVKTMEFAQDGTAEGENTSVITANIDWTAVTSAEWLRIEPASGSKGIDAIMTVTALSANDTYVARTATITITGGEATETIEVKQAGKPAWLQLPVSWVIHGNDPAYMCAKSPRWGTNGANDVTFGSGEGIAYSEDSEMAYAEFLPKPCSHITFIIAQEGHYTIKGKVKLNDALVFHVPVEKIEAGTKLKFQTGTQCVKGMAKHWAIEFFDNGEWHMGDTGKTFTASNGETANIELATTGTTRTATYTLTKTIEKDMLKVRFRCVDNTVAISGKITATSTVRFSHRPNDGVVGPTISIVE